MTGTATVGGIFDVEQWFLSLLASETTVTLPLYVSYILLAYDDIYDVYERTIGRLPAALCLNRERAIRHAALLGRRPRRAAADLAGPPHVVLLRRASSRTRRIRCASACARTRWTSGGRGRPCASTTATDDEEAPYEDALASVERLRSRGADVTVRTLPGFDHVNSWIQAMPRAVTWFRSLD